MFTERIKPEKKFEAVKGARAFYIRHSQKDLVGGGRNVSIGGYWRAEELGQFIKSGWTSGQQLSWSRACRTKQTGEGIKLGKNTGQEKEYRTISRSVLDYEEGPKFNKVFKLWEKKVDQEIERILVKRGLSRQDLSKMDNDQREEIENESEEPFLEDWLSNHDSEAAKIYSPDKIVEQLAPQVRRDIKIVDRLDGGSFIDLLKISHKGILEPLLLKILVLPNGEKAKNLAEIGSSFRAGEGFSIETEVAQDGQKQTKLLMYRRVHQDDYWHYDRQEFQVDLEELDRLADEALNKDKKND